MDSKELERLLEKYWACETTLEEEQMLREYFRTTPATEATRDAAVMFAYFDMQRTRQLDDASLDERIANMAKPKVRPLIRFVHNGLRIAAGIAVLVAAVWLVHDEIRENTPQEMLDTDSDPELAFEETKRALLIIARGFGAAEEQARKLDLFNEAQQKIRNEMTNQSEEEVKREL